MKLSHSFASWIWVFFSLLSYKLLGCPRKLVYNRFVTGLWPTYKWGIYWGYNPLTNHLLTSWDIQVGPPITPLIFGWNNPKLPHFIQAIYKGDLIHSMFVMIIGEPPCGWNLIAVPESLAIVPVEKTPTRRGPPSYKVVITPANPI